MKKENPFLLSMPTFYPLPKVTTANSVLDFLPESIYKYRKTWDFPGSPVVKDLPASAGDLGLIPALERSHKPHVSEPVLQSP